MPKPSTPALLETIVRSFVPLRWTAAMRFSGMPQRPKPPMRMVMPSLRLAMAASGEEMRLSMGENSTVASDEWRVASKKQGLGFGRESKGGTPGRFWAKSAEGVEDKGDKNRSFERMAKNEHLWRNA